MIEEEFDNEMEELKDSLQHKRIRKLLWEQVIHGKYYVFGKYLSSDSHKISKWMGSRESAVDMIVNILDADLEMGLQMIREHWNEEGE